MKLQAQVSSHELRMHGQAEAIKSLESALKLKETALAGLQDDLQVCVVPLWYQTSAQNGELLNIAVGHACHLLAS